MNAKATPALASPGCAALYLRVSTGAKPNMICRFPISGVSYAPIARGRGSLW